MKLLFSSSKRQNRLNEVSDLLEKGANPNLQDGHHQTPLHRACEHSQVEAATLLLTKAHNIDVNIQDLMGRTALHWAAAKYELTRNL